MNLAPSYTTSDLIETDGGEGVVATAISISPHVPIFNPDGSYTQSRNFEVFSGAGGFSPNGNPLELAREISDTQNRFRLLTSIFAEYELVDDLKFKINLGADYNTSRRDFYRPSYVNGPGRALAPTNPVGVSAAAERINWLTEFTLAYDKSFGENHTVNAVAGYTVQKENLKANSFFGTDFPNDLVPTLNAAGSINTSGSNYEDWSLLSLLGRVNYAYKNKYLLTATVRRDGSSRFGPDNRYGTFPSASIGWRVGEEGFMKNVGFINEMKIRASYGESGNFNIPNFGFLGLLNINRVVLGDGSGSVLSGLAPSSIPNNELTWERSNQYDIGFELGLFNNRIALTTDYYIRETSDLLLNVNVPATTGFTSALVNIGKVENKGLEISLNTKNLVNEFRWDTDFNISFNENKVLELGPSGDPIFASFAGISNSHITEIGSPVGSYYGLNKLGVFQTQAEVDSSPIFEGDRATQVGDYKYEDIDGDGQITEGEDRKIIGDPYPDFVFGFNNTFSYKNVELSILIRGAQGLEVLNYLDRSIGNSAGNVNLLRSAYDGRFISESNPGNGVTPRLNRIPKGLNNNFSSRYIEDASYIRAQNITLGYRFTPESLKNTGFNSLRLYLSAQNAFTITDYTGYNPEVSVNGSSALAGGVDNGTFPLARTFTVGLNLGF